MEGIEAEVLFCCPKCRGILYSKEAFKEHKSSCDGSLDKSSCDQFVCDKNSLVQKETSDKKKIKRNTGDDDEASKPKSLSGDEEVPLKRPRRAAAIKLLKQWDSMKIKTEDEDKEPEKSDKNQKESKESASLMENNDKPNQDDDRKPRKPDAEAKRTKGRGRKRKQLADETDEGDNDKAVNQTEAKNLLYVEIIHEVTDVEIKKEIFEDTNETEENEYNKENEKSISAEDKEKSQGEKIKLEEINRIEHSLTSDVEDDSMFDVEGNEDDDVTEDWNRTREDNTPAKKKKRKRKMDKLLVDFIKSGKLQPAPVKKEKNNQADYGEDEDNDDQVYYEDMRSAKGSKVRKSKLGRPPLWSVEYRAKYNRLKLMYEQYHVPPTEEEKVGDKWERLPGSYQCPNCPIKLKKVANFHKHMTQWHKEGGESDGGMNTENDEGDTSKRKFDPMEKYDPEKHISRIFYQRRRAEWAVEYEKYVIRNSEGGFSHYQCPACEYVSKIMGHFHRHISRIHTSMDGTVDGRVEKWKCELCDFETLRKPTLKQHMLVHNRPFLCEYCPRRFGNKKNLADHVMLHEGINPRKCPYCDYTTRQKRCLEEHVRKHTGDLLQCEHCEFETPYYAGLKMHVLTKHKEKTLYPCNEVDCEYVTNDKTSYNKHMMLHSGQKEYRCSQCDYQGVTKYEVIKHLKSVHDNQKMYYCDRCDYSSAYSTAFRNHIMVHLDLKPYRCSDCDYSAPQKTRVDLHVKSKHPNDNARTVTSESYHIDITPFKRQLTEGPLFQLYAEKVKENDEGILYGGENSVNTGHVVLGSSNYQHIAQQINNSDADGTEQQFILVEPNMTVDDSIMPQEMEHQKQEILKVAFEQADADNIKTLDPVTGELIADDDSAVQDTAEEEKTMVSEEFENKGEDDSEQLKEIKSIQPKEARSHSSITESEPSQSFKTESEHQQEVSNEQEDTSTYTYQIVDPQGQMHYVEVSHPLGVDENIVFVTEPHEGGEEAGGKTAKE